MASNVWIFLVSWLLRDLRAPKRFSDIFDTAHGYAGKVHLNKGFLDRAFTAFVAFDDGRLELDALEFGHAQLDFTGSRAEIPLVMTGTVALTVSRPLILASTDKLVRLMVEQGIQCFFYAVAYKILYR